MDEAAESCASQKLAATWFAKCGGRMDTVEDVSMALNS